MNWAGVVFTNPALWIGVGALGVPLLVHLLTRRARRTLRFPTIRFLKTAKASQSSVYKLRHLLLLLLRTAFIALLLMAFLKPVQQASTLAAGANPDAKHVVVIILDVSASMGYNGHGITTLARGKLAAEKILDDLGSADLANLILATAAPRPSFDEPTNNKPSLRHDIQNAALTQERAELDAAIAEAVRQLGKLSGYRSEIHLISDFQRTNWASVQFAAIPKDVRTVFVPVGADDARNIALTEVILQPALPAVGEEVEVICKISNFTRLIAGNGLGEQLAQSSRLWQLPVQLRFDDQMPLRRDISLAPGTTASVSFRIKPHRSGVFEGELSIPDDTLVADNKRFFTLRVSEQVQVLLLTDEDRLDTSVASVYLARALNPFTERGKGSVAVSVLSSAQFDKFAAARAQLVVIVGVQEFPKALTAQLLKYLKDGGSIIYFLSRSADATNLTALESASAGDLKLPFNISRLVDRATNGSSAAADATSGADDFASLGEANFDHAILKPFKESRELGGIRFLRYFVTEREQGQGEVLLRFDDRNIALARKSVGAGALLLANFSPALKSSDLAKRPLFIPLLHEMVKGMRPQGGAERVFVVGYPVTTTVKLVNQQKEVRLASPSGERISAVFELNSNEAAIVFPPTKESGFYRVFNGDAKTGSVAVNLDNRESNLESLSLKQLQELSEISRERFLAVAGGDRKALQELREGKPLWPYCLLLALCVLSVEQALFAVWRR